MVLSTARWFYLVLMIVLTVVGFLSAIKTPGPMGWFFVWVVGGYGHWLAAFPIVIGIGAWLARRGHPVVTGFTFVFCALAFLLFLKPTAQAWRLSRSLPADLASAFGPAKVSHSPMSFAELFVGAPTLVSTLTLNYSQSLKLDFYRAEGRSPAPCVIVLHGGGWCVGDRRECTQFSCWLAHRGYAVASIDYRLAPIQPWPGEISGSQKWFKPPNGIPGVPTAIWPAQREDVLAAIAYLKLHSQELGIDPEQFVLMGRSAGGNIAEATAYAVHDPAIRGVISFYGPTDMRASWSADGDNSKMNVNRQLTSQFLGGSPTTAGDRYDDASPVRLVTGDSPPTLMLHGQMDTVIRIGQSQELSGKLTAAGVKQALVTLPWATHGFDYTANLDSPGGQIAAYCVDYFLQTVTH